MILKFEDSIWNVGPSYEYINSDRIFRIRLTRKRIRIYFNSSFWSMIYFERTENNMNELKKLEKESGFWMW